MAYPKRFSRPERAPDAPTARKPVRYVYTDDTREEIRAISVTLDTSADSSFDALNKMLGLIEQVKAELLWKSRRYQPWRTPFNPREHDDDSLDSEEIGDGVIPEFHLPPPRR